MGAACREYMGKKQEMETRTELENTMTAGRISSDFREVKVKREGENPRAEIDTDRSTVRVRNGNGACCM